MGLLSYSVLYDIRGTKLYMAKEFHRWHDHNCHANRQNSKTKQKMSTTFDISGSTCTTATLKLCQSLRHEKRI